MKIFARPKEKPERTRQKGLSNLLQNIILLKRLTLLRRSLLGLNSEWHHMVRYDGAIESNRPRVR